MRKRCAIFLRLPGLADKNEPSSFARVRLWTIHPKHLDAKGLVAAWREALLAQKVLAGKTRGYRNHPQLARFRAQRDPQAAIAGFLAALHDEAVLRGYAFDATKIGALRFTGKIAETDGQLLHEWRHLLRKLKVRAPKFYAAQGAIKRPEPHPLFRIVKGGVREREKAQGEGEPGGSALPCRRRSM